MVKLVSLSSTICLLDSVSPCLDDRRWRNAQHLLFAGYCNIGLRAKINTPHCYLMTSTTPSRCSSGFGLAFDHVHHPVTATGCVALFLTGCGVYCVALF